MLRGDSHALLARVSGGDSGENAVVQGTDVLSPSLSDIVDSSRAVFAVLAIVAAVLIGQ